MPLQKDRLCQSCKRVNIRGHFNRKWCRRCSRDRRVRPRSTLTAEQKSYVLEMRGKISGREIAKELGVSWSNVMRFARDRRMSLATLSGSRKWKLQPHLVRKILNYYFVHGKTATVKAFPDMSVRSLVDRPEFYGIKRKYRQTRWTNEEIILAAKMAGLVDGKTQSKIFNRPGANEGSIKSLWMKRFKCSGGNVHGMSEWMAKQILKPGYPVIKTRMWTPRKSSKNSDLMRGLVLWCDMGAFVRKDIPAFITESIQAMAQFQCWLFDTQNPRAEIMKVLKGQV